MKVSFRGQLFRYGVMVAFGRRSCAQPITARFLTKLRHQIVHHVHGGGQNWKS